MEAEEEAFIAACVSAPADNGPRLVYGDWLQSRGDARGELMVVQCRLAEGAATSAPAAEEKKLRATEKKLAKAIEKQLAGSVAEHLGYPSDYADALLVRVDIERGFITALQAPADVLQRLDQAFEVAPLLTELRISSIPPYEALTTIDASYFTSPLLARVRRLGMGQLAHADALLRIVAACPHFANLEALAFNNTRFNDDPQHRLTGRGIAALVESKHLGRLVDLAFDDDSLGDEGIHAIARGPWKLESLSVASNGATGAAFASLAGALHHGGLRRLRVCGVSNPSAEQVAALVSAKHLASLTALDIERCDLGLDGLAALLDALALPALEELVAASNGFGEKGADLIAKSTKLSKLKTLDLTKNGFNKKGIVALANGTGLAGISKVLLNERDSEDARTALAASKALAKTTVYFRGKQLAKAKG